MMVGTTTPSVVFTPAHSGPGRNQSAPKLMFGDLFCINPEEMFGFPGIFAKMLLPTFSLMSKL